MLQLLPAFHDDRGSTTQNIRIVTVPGQFASAVTREEKSVRVNAGDDNKERVKRLFGWIGFFCLLAIIPVKAVRFVDETAASSLLVGVGPSLLGPGGLLFLILSGSGRLSRLTLAHLAILVSVIALGLEFAQLLPRPGILANVHYTFDWLDVMGSLLSVCVAYVVAGFMIKRNVIEHGA